jgi:hypothetical protein
MKLLFHEDKKDKMFNVLENLPSTIPDEKKILIKGSLARMFLLNDLIDDGRNLFTDLLKTCEQKGIRKELWTIWKGWTEAEAFNDRKNKSSIREWFFDMCEQFSNSKRILTYVLDSHYEYESNNGDRQFLPQIEERAREHNINLTK